MFLTISWGRGPAVDALVLALGAHRMRVIPIGSADTLELNLTDSSWNDDRGRPVTIDCISSFLSDAERCCAELFPLASAACG